MLLTCKIGCPPGEALPPAGDVALEGTQDNFRQAGGVGSWPRGSRWSAPAQFRGPRPEQPCCGAQRTRGIDASSDLREDTMTATGNASSWRSAAACLAADPDLFFPISARGLAEKQIARAKISPASTS